MPEPTPLDPARFRATVGGQTVALYTLRNRHGMAAAITNHGARIEQLLAPDRDGELGDVVLGHDSIEQVLAGQASMGAFIARFAGRIAQGRFALDGQAHQLSRNEGPHHLHGGTNGSRFRVFEARQTSASSVEMTLVFADGEDGYPGTLSLRVRYCVTDDNALVIDYAGLAADRPTIANFTSHAFFNLSGEGAHPSSITCSPSMPTGFWKWMPPPSPPAASTAWSARRWTFAGPRPSARASTTRTNN